MLWNVEVGICWTSRTWNIIEFKISAGSEEDAKKLGHELAVKYVEEHDALGEAAHFFTYSCYLDEDEE